VFLGLHGNPTWSFLYRHIVPGLRDRFRCLVLDYPGFGLSVAPAGYERTGEPGGLLWLPTVSDLCSISGMSG